MQGLGVDFEKICGIAMNIFSRNWGGRKTPLEDFVSSEVIKNLQEVDTFTPMLQPEKVRYLIAHVRDDNLDLISGYVSQAIDELIEKNGIVVGVFSSLIFVVFRSSQNMLSDQITELENAAEGLHQLLEDNVRICYGESEGLFGTFGSRQFASYGPVLCNMNNILDSILKIRYGEICRVS